MRTWTLLWQHICTKSISQNTPVSVPKAAAAKNKVLHFESFCPEFHHARTAAHNKGYKVLAALLHKHLAAHWSLYHETQLSQRGLVLELVLLKLSPLQLCYNQVGKSLIYILKLYT